MKPMTLLHFCLSFGLLALPGLGSAAEAGDRHVWNDTPPPADEPQYQGLDKRFLFAQVKRRRSDTPQEPDVSPEPDTLSTDQPAESPTVTPEGAQSTTGSEERTVEGEPPTVQEGTTATPDGASETAAQSASETSLETQALSPPPPPGIKRQRPGGETHPIRTRPMTPPPPLAEDERRRPGLYEPPPEPTRPLPDPNRRTGLGQTEPPAPDEPGEFIPVPDRWRLSKDLNISPENWLDPYNRNLLKGDRPVFGRDWFFNVTLISDTVLEPRNFPVPVAPQVSQGSGNLDVIGDGNQFFFNQNLILGLVLYKGDTVFRPPDYEFRLTPVFNYNYVKTEELRLLYIDPQDGEDRSDSFVGLQEAFADIHLRNVSDRYDFDSVRFGIQPFSSDFRGFLFQDNQLGVRLFGSRDNNLWQYNLAWFRRLEKDTNSGLNDVTASLRDDDIFFANLYRQDFPSRGFTSQITAAYNRNREGDDGLYFDKNGFLARPAPIGMERGRDYDVTYLGYNGDGHFGRLNLTASAYYAFGKESPGVFVDKDLDIRAFFAAAEGSMDFDWIRLRGSLLYATGDSDPYDDRAEGYDAIFENPLFAGADASYWIRQAVPLIGGGGVSLSTRNGILNSLRTSKDLGQSNFTNPGLILFGVGGDFDVTPELRLSFNANKLYFNDTAVLEVLRNQASIDSDIGWDLSASLIYRPNFIQNVVFRLSGAVLVPGDGFVDLYGDDDTPYSILANMVLTY